jgi:hypothetical protein
MGSAPSVEAVSISNNRPILMYEGRQHAQFLMHTGIAPVHLYEDCEVVHATHGRMHIRIIRLLCVPAQSKACHIEFKLNA